MPRKRANRPVAPIRRSLRETSVPAPPYNPEVMTDEKQNRFPAVFWTANVTELFERAAYYSMASFVVIYLGQLGLGEHWPSNLNSVLWTLVYFLPILSGTIADQVGFRKSLLVAFVLLAIGYMLMGSPVWFGGAKLAPTVGKEGCPHGFDPGPAHGPLPIPRR